MFLGYYCFEKYIDILKHKNIYLDEYRYYLYLQLPIPRELNLFEESFFFNLYDFGYEDNGLQIT